MSEVYGEGVSTEFAGKPYPWNKCQSDAVCDVVSDVLLMPEVCRDLASLDDVKEMLSYRHGHEHSDIDAAIEVLRQSGLLWIDSCTVDERMPEWVRHREGFAWKQARSHARSKARAKLSAIEAVIAELDLYLGSCAIQDSGAAPDSCAPVVQGKPDPGSLWLCVVALQDYYDGTGIPGRKAWVEMTPPDRHLRKSHAGSEAEGIAQAAEDFRNLLVKEQSALAAADNASKTHVANVLLDHAKQWVNRPSRDGGPTEAQCRFVQLLIRAGGRKRPADMNTEGSFDYVDPRDAFRKLVKRIEERLIKTEQVWRIVAEDRGEIAIVKFVP